MDYQSEFDRWCENVSEPVLAAQLAEMRERADAQAIEDAFFQELEFGTGGLRGVLGAGTNRMNIYTVGKATQGIADYIKTHVGVDGTVAICFDSRINSRLFAETAAGVLAANGITSHIYSRLEPTPALSFATRYLGCAIGINVTASHNPSAYNGYKVYGPDGCQITDEIADAITEAIAQVDVFEDVRTMDFARAIDEGLVRYINEEVLDAFLDAVYEQSLEAPDEQGELRLVYTPLNGTGLECVNRILERIGVRDVYMVGEQAYPDGNFPTCPYPNPEIREALERGIALCEQVKPDLLLATDPDADRVGIAVKDGDDYQLLTGNETGALLFDYICRMRSQLGKMPARPLAVTTIVSTSIVDAIAADHGVELKRVLTGFKYIGGIQRRESSTASSSASKRAMATWQDATRAIRTRSWLRCSSVRWHVRIAQRGRTSTRPCRIFTRSMAITTIVRLRSPSKELRVRRAWLRSWIRCARMVSIALRGRQCLKRSTINQA